MVIKLKTDVEERLRDEVLISGLPASSRYMQTPSQMSPHVAVDLAELFAKTE